MKKLMAIILISTLASCSGGDYIRSRAEHFVRDTYPDVDRILYYNVDTITLKNNLEYRIEQAEQFIHFAEEMLELTERSNMERVRYSGAPDEKGVKEKTEKLQFEKDRKAALDSLMKATPPDVLNSPAAYQCCIAYNTSNNLVWLQLDPVGNLLVISKDRMKMYLNPGGDVPGYFEVNSRFSRY